MGEIKSSISNKTFESKPLRSFTVEDKSGALEESNVPTNTNGEGSVSSVQLPQTVEEVMAMRRQKMANAQVPSDVGRRRVEMLVGIGRATKNIPIESPNGAVVFSVRSLKGRETSYLAQVTAELAKADVISSIFQGRLLALALAVYAVDGTDIDIVLDCRLHSEEDRIKLRMSFLEELDEVILNRVYDEWNSMVKENNAKFAIKNETDAKEVALDIKKSG